MHTYKILIVVSLGWFLIQRNSINHKQEYFLLDCDKYKKNRIIKLTNLTKWSLNYQSKSSFFKYGIKNVEINLIIYYIINIIAEMKLKISQLLSI